jgi:hypothetical protein
VLPSEYPEIAKWPSLQQLAAVHFDMLVRDVRTLFRLPMPECDLHEGMNLTIGNQLCTIIAGASVCLYDTSREVYDDHSGRGDRFKAVVRDYFPAPEHRPELVGYIPVPGAPPWTAADADDVDAATAAEVLWLHVRNPMAHAFGLHIGTKHPEVLVQFAKPNGMPLAEILAWEDSPSRPGKAIIADHGPAGGSGKPHYVVNLPSLLWAVHRMLRNLIADDAHAARSDAVAHEFVAPDDTTP